MSDIMARPVPPMVPDEADSQLAETASRELARASMEAIKVQLDDGKELVLPKAVTPLLIYLLTEMGQGNAVTLIPVHAELTTQEAANLLNVSRPHLIRLLENKEIPFHKAGTHRRVKFVDLQAYRERFEEKRRETMSELAKEAQELGMGY